MSMISAQIDELRNTAEFYDGFKAANLMRDAADTIWQLRDDLQRTNAENDKLRELVRDMFGAYKGTVEMLPSSYSKNVAERAVMDISDRMRELGVEVDE